MSKENRREYGSGSVSQRKDGTWTARMIIGHTPSGNPKIKAFYGKTEREVRKKLKDFKIEFYKNDQTVVDNKNTGSYINNWLYTKKVNELKDKSFDRLEQTVKYQVLPYIGMIKLKSLNANDIQTMINSLKNSGLSWSTVKKAYDAVNDCFKTAVIRRDMQFNPASGVSVPTQKMFEKQSEVKYFTDDEVDRLIETATSKYSNGVRKYRLGDLVSIGINTGMRVAEMLGLKWKDVDLDNRKIYINTTRVIVKNRGVDSKNKYVVIEQDSGKTERSIRSIDINDAAYDAFMNIKEVTGNFEYVLSTKNGKPVNPRFPDKTLRNIAVASGFPENRIFGMHSLRHTFATKLFSAGYEVKVVSELLGHSNTKLTENIYIHVIDEIRRKAIQSI